MDGSYFDDIIETSEGPVRVLAETHIFGTHLVLDELLVYPRQQPGPLRIGVRQALAIFRRVRVFAQEEGFTELTVVYHRTGNQRSGRIISRTRKLI